MCLIKHDLSNKIVTMISGYIQQEWFDYFLEFNNWSTTAVSTAKAPPEKGQVAAFNAAAADTATWKASDVWSATMEQRYLGDKPGILRLLVGYKPLFVSWLLVALSTSVNWGWQALLHSH